jgi:formylglycine-generating enzyme required for sulfatase activity
MDITREVNYMANVFLSYKKEDLEIADRLVAALRKEGMSVWWDDGLTPKAAWDEEIEREISAASTVVVLWSPRSVSSEWVRREAHFAQDRGKLVPVIVEATSIPIAFTLNQTVNLTGWDGNGENRQWRKLLTWITDLVSIRPGNANIPQAPGAPPPNRFRDAVGYMASGDPIVGGTLVNASTPAGTAFCDGEQLPVMRIVSKGSFLLGATADDPDHASYEAPQKRVEIPAPFAIGVFPILVSEYQNIIGSPAPTPALHAPVAARGWLGKHKVDAVPVIAATPRLFNARVPILRVSFDEAQAFVDRLTSTTGENYRIPSEAEWEYACRAGSRTRYHCGDVIDPTKAAFGLTAGPVEPGSFPPNASGLYDMHGNVREWTADLWHDSYDLTPSDGRAVTEGHGSMRVVRGGGWSDNAAMLRSAARMRATQSVRTDVIGFRVVRTLG